MLDYKNGYTLGSPFLIPSPESYLLHNRVKFFIEYSSFPLSCASYLFNEFLQFKRRHLETASPRRCQSGRRMFWAETTANAKILGQNMLGLFEEQQGDSGGRSRVSEGKRKLGRL